MEKFIVTTFYKFINLPSYLDLRIQLLKLCNSLSLKGTILLAEEGLNSTLSGTRENVDKFYGLIKEMPEFADLEFKESESDYQPFKRMKVRLKKEIVTFKVDDLDMNLRGEYLDHQTWDDLLAREDSIVIDTRNDYEITFGTFEKAIDPKLNSFSELPEWLDKNLKEEDKEKPVLMFCTGGIRCEKSTAYLKQKGFKQVYHLRGGILKYFEEGKNSNNKWIGSCFVFDDRLAVDSKLMSIEG
jgi:UPF0176 protein